MRRQHHSAAERIAHVIVDRRHAANDDGQLDSLRDRHIIIELLMSRHIEVTK